MYGLFPQLSYVPCLGIAACLTLTNLIISAVIVGGKDFIDRKSRVAQLLVLAFLAVDAAKVLDFDDLFAAFATSSAITWDGDFKDHIGEVFSSFLDLLLNCACFVYIGAWLPPDT
ncbi:hypothetical protein FISHEDRAFT_71371 [Fistulina hepatica ATCC 64428]|nr:hypothetical protein FISHEDRAFT_71371 [Fistulina hepatica ATCC 64428]